ncbi:uncharacterized protein LOC108666344 isoform X2 [Hyalella azteca]|uniref:Uncharacterized protein LOC108666344 isoform X2 n=1 Tax=Hyalella azteca TaxID=294128 RepID=A0A8B7N4B1_HYAAZ|nr:uncharacterized protein LOC108666344 isoform X2 [Hyalella azteca]
MVLIHKKIFREDRLLQIALALSVLRMVPDLIQSAPPLSSLEHNPMFEQHADIMDYFGITRDQVLHHLSHELLARLHHDELQNLLNSANIHHPDYGETSFEHLHHQQFDLGDTMGQSPWRHHSRISRHLDGPSYDWNVPEILPSVSLKEREAVMERLMALADGNANARLNGLVSGRRVPILETTSQRQGPNSELVPSPSKGDAIPTEDINVGEENQRCVQRRAESFNIQAYMLVGQTTVIPNSTSANGSRDVLRPLTNPTPPSSAPASPPPSSAQPATPTLPDHSTPPLSPLPHAHSSEDFSSSSLDNTAAASHPASSRFIRNFPLLGLSTTGLRVNEGLLLPALQAALPYIDEFTIEERAVLQALWMQDQDLGVPWDIYEEPEPPLLQEEVQELPLKGLLVKGETLLSRGALDASGDYTATGGGGGGGGQPEGDASGYSGEDREGAWTSLNFTLDAETGEHFRLFDCDIREEFKPEYHHTSPSVVSSESLSKHELKEELVSDEGLEDICRPSRNEPSSQYSEYDHLLSEPTCQVGQKGQKSDKFTTKDLFHEAAEALLLDTLPSGTRLPEGFLPLANCADSRPTAGPVSSLSSEIKIEEPFSYDPAGNLVQALANADTLRDSAALNISSVDIENLSSILSSEDTDAINALIQDIPQELDVDGLFNRSDLNFSLDEFSFEGFPEELQVVNDSGRQTETIKVENTSNAQSSLPGYSPFFSLGAANDDESQSYKRRRLFDHFENFASEDPRTRIRRPSSSASSGHGTLSDDSDGVATPTASSAAVLDNFDLFSSTSNNSGIIESSGDLPDLGIGADSVDLGSLASLNCLNSSLDEMIQASYQHNRAMQGRMGGMLRGGSMDQRWQDLASLLSLPSSGEGATSPTLHHPPPVGPPTSTAMTTHHHHHHHHHHPPPPNHLLHQPAPLMTPSHHSGPPPPPPPPPHQQQPPTIHHPHALYPAHDVVGGGSLARGGLLHNAALPPDPNTHDITYANSMGATSHLGASGSNTQTPEHLGDHHHHHHHPHHHQHHQYKMETSSPSSSLIPAPPAPPALPHDMLYYQSSGGGGGGSSELASTGGGHPHPSTGAQHGDGFLSSILGEDDLHLMDMAIASDYPRVSGHPASTSGGSGVLSPHGLLGSSGGDYANNAAYRGWSLSPDDQQRLAAPVAQKKHHMFGKRYFQDGPPEVPPHHGSNRSSLVGNNSHYPTPYQQPPSAMDTTPAPSSHIPDPMELKYSCSMDFRGHHEVSSSLEHIHHNHTYHMSPEGPSGLPRPSQRDPNKSKARKPEPERALTRDEKRARALNLPISCDDIIHLPMDEFNERISKYDLTENQLSLIRDIRRRGKNKVAAQNCRKRKLDQIMHLAEEVKVIQSRKNELISQYEFLSGERLRVKHKFSLLYRHIFQHLRDSEGQPYSPHDYNLQQSADGSVLLVPKSAPHLPLDPGLPPIPTNSSKQDDDPSKGRPSHQQPPHQHHNPH